MLEQSEADVSFFIIQLHPSDAKHASNSVRLNVEAQSALDVGTWVGESLGIFDVGTYVGTALGAVVQFAVAIPPI